MGYGGVGSAEAVEHLRNISVELQMAPVRSGVHIAGADFVAVSKGQKTLDDLAYLEQNAKDLLDNLVLVDQRPQGGSREGLSPAAGGRARPGLPLGERQAPIGGCTRLAASAMACCGSFMPSMADCDSSTKMS